MVMICTDFGNKASRRMVLLMLLAFVAACIPLSMAAPPSGLSYPSSAYVWYVGIPINNGVLTPVSTGGAVDSYSIYSGTLPFGIQLNSITGEISGTASGPSAVSQVTIQASNGEGNTRVILTVSVKDITITYASSNVILTVKKPITAMSPTTVPNDGMAASYYFVEPALPIGLFLNAATGVISGTSIAVAPPLKCTVTAANPGGGSAKFDITFTVVDVAPANLAYSSSTFTFYVGVIVSGITPTYSGGPAMTWSVVSGTLPFGLSLRQSDGTISGQPMNGISAPTVVVIKALNSGGGSASVALTIGVSQISISYTSNVVSLTIGTVMPDMNPIVTPPSGATTFSLSKPLPNGLSLNTATGLISGTPGMITPSDTYTITASNAAGGVAQFAIAFSVIDIPPTSLSYGTAQFTWYIGVPLSAGSIITPSVSGGAVVGYTIESGSALLPDGILVDSVTGAITGTPRSVYNNVVTIKAVNSGGSAVVTLTINVLQISVTYPTDILTVTVNTKLPASLSPIVTPPIGADLFSISPPLPVGLTLDPSTGLIDGTPSAVVTPSRTYTITATNSGGGIAQFNLQVEVLPQPIATTTVPPTTTRTTTTAATTTKSAMQRTVILIQGVTSSGQDMFIRGGFDTAKLKSLYGKTCTNNVWSYASNPCVIDITHNNMRNSYTKAWKVGDTVLDWYGIQPGQGTGAQGTAMEWTTNEKANKNTVAVQGFGYEPMNTFGANYWMLDVQMNCAQTINGMWFEFKSFISNGPGWEADVAQAGTPYTSGNHFAKCGMINVFARGSSSATFLSFPASAAVGASFDVNAQRASAPSSATFMTSTLLTLVGSVILVLVLAVIGVAVYIRKSARSRKETLVQVPAVSGGEEYEMSSVDVSEGGRAMGEDKGAIHMQHVGVVHKDDGYM